MQVPPGPLSVKTAQYLTELGRRTSAALRVTGVPPMNVTRGADGQVVIGMSSRLYTGVGLQLFSTSIPTATFTLLEFPTGGFGGEDWDRGEWHSTTVNPSRITFPETGFYAMGAYVAWDGSVTTGYRFATLYLDGSAGISAVSSSATPAGAGGSQNLFAHWMAREGSYLELGVEQNSGGNLTCGARLWAWRVG